MVACSICDEPYDAATRPPLWLACCKSMHLCAECITQHLKMGTNKCIICPSRPSVRNFLAQCEKATPATLLEELREKKEIQEQEEYKSKPKPIELGKAGLMDEYAKARGIVKEGDGEAALKLQMQIEEEERQEVKKAEDRDLQIAKRLQEMEEKETQNLRKRLTKAPNLSGIAQHGRSSAHVHSQGTLTLHSYFGKVKKREGEEDEAKEGTGGGEGGGGGGSKKARTGSEEVIILSP